MRRFLSSLLVLLCAGVAALAVPRTTMQQISSTDCTVEACTSSSASYCLAGTALHICDTLAGFYTAIASSDILNLEGPTGDTYLIRDADTGFIAVYLDNVLKATITPRGVIPGPCGSNVYAAELGTQCVDSSGRTIFVTTSGPVALR